MTRAEEERKLSERKKAEEERRVRELEEKKQREQEEKRQRLEDAEKKRQLMMQALKDQSSKKGPNFTIQKREPGVSLTFFNTSLSVMSILLRPPLVPFKWKGTKPKSNSKKRKEYPFPFVLNPLILITLA